MIKRIYLDERRGADTNKFVIIDRQSTIHNQSLPLTKFFFSSFFKFYLNANSYKKKQKLTKFYDNAKKKQKKKSLSLILKMLL